MTLKAKCYFLSFVSLTLLILLITRSIADDCNTNNYAEDYIEISMHNNIKKEFRDSEIGNCYKKEIINNIETTKQCEFIPLDDYSMYLSSLDIRGSSMSYTTCYANNPHIYTMGPIAGNTKDKNARDEAKRTKEFYTDDPNTQGDIYLLNQINDIINRSNNLTEQIYAQNIICVLATNPAECYANIQPLTDELIRIQREKNTYVAASSAFTGMQGFTYLPYISDAVKYGLFAWAYAINYMQVNMDLKYMAATTPLKSVAYDILPTFKGGAKSDSIKYGQPIEFNYNIIGTIRRHPKNNDNCTFWQCKGDGLEIEETGRIATAVVVYHVDGADEPYFTGIQTGVVQLYNNGGSSWTGKIPWYKLKQLHVRPHKDGQTNTRDIVRYALVAIDEFGNIATEDLFYEYDDLSYKNSLPIVDVVCPGTSRNCYPILDPIDDISYMTNENYYYENRYGQYSCCDNLGESNFTPWSINQNYDLWKVPKGKDIQGIKLKLNKSILQGKFYFYPDRGALSSWGNYYKGKNNPVNRTLGIFLKNPNSDVQDTQFRDATLLLYAPDLPSNVNDTVIYDLKCLSDSNTFFKFMKDNSYNTGTAPLIYCVEGAFDYFYSNYYKQDKGILTTSFTSIGGNMQFKIGIDYRRFGESGPVSIYLFSMDYQYGNYNINTIKECQINENPDYCKIIYEASIDRIPGINYYRQYNTVKILPGSSDAPELLGVECNGVFNKTHAVCTRLEGPGNDTCVLTWKPVEYLSQHGTDYRFRIFRSEGIDDTSTCLSQESGGNCVELTTKENPFNGYVYTDATPKKPGTTYYYYVGSVLGENGFNNLMKAECETMFYISGDKTPGCGGN